MTTTRIRWFNALFHRGPGYDLPAQSETDLRATLTALVDRWAIQLADYNEQATELGDGRAARRDAHIRGTRLEWCISDLNTALAKGRLPHDLADGQPLLPRRGDDVAEWIKQRRDQFDQRHDTEWDVLDNLLDQYRLHVDTGTPLDDHICEGRVVGDCDCFETGGTR